MASLALVKTLMSCQFIVWFWGVWPEGVEPKRSMGPYWEKNVITMCSMCNLMKGARGLQSFVTQWWNYCIHSMSLRWRCVCIYQPIRGAEILASSPNVFEISKRTFFVVMGFNRLLSCEYFKTKSELVFDGHENVQSYKWAVSSTRTETMLLLW